MLITHHIEEIVPEIERIILRKQGRILASGSKRAILTTKHLGDLFDSPVALDETDGYFYARPAR